MGCAWCSPGETEAWKAWAVWRHSSLAKVKGQSTLYPHISHLIGEKKLPAAWAALSPFLFVSPGVCFLLLGWKIRAKAALGWVWHFLLTFFFCFPLPYLTISPAAMGWKSSAFPEKEPLELAHQAEAEPSREVFFVASRSPRQGSASSREAPRLGCMLLRCFSLFKSKSNRSSKPPLMSSFPPLRCRDARPSKRAEHPPPHPCARAFPSLEASCGM